MITTIDINFITITEGIVIRISIEWVCVPNTDFLPIVQAIFIGMGGSYKEVAAPLDKEPTDKVLAELKELISAYLEPDQGFSSRRMLHKDSDIGDYDHLARFGEWDRTAETYPEDLS